jgi:hypothetical protein
MKITDLEDYVANFRRRVLQDALNEATAAYWRQRAAQFEAVGNARCDEIAVACRNRAAIALGAEEDTPSSLWCPTCGTHTSPWTCSCGQTRVGGALRDVG